MDRVSQFASHHWQLVLAFVILFIVLMVYEYVALKKQGKALSTAQVVEQINHFDAVVIDTRPAEAFKKGHIIGAVRASAADFKLPKMQQYKSKPIILVCARGLESRTLIPQIHALGFTQAVVLAGGLEAWQAANLPLVKK